MNYRKLFRVHHTAAYFSSIESSWNYFWIPTVNILMQKHATNTKCINRRCKRMQRESFDIEWCFQVCCVCFSFQEYLYSCCCFFVFNGTLGLWWRLHFVRYSVITPPFENIEAIEAIWFRSNCVMCISWVNSWPVCLWSFFHLLFAPNKRIDMQIIVCTAVTRYTYVMNSTEFSNDF